MSESFFHTVYFSKLITFEESDVIFNKYKEAVCRNGNNYSITKFNREGIRIILVKRSDIETKYDSMHRKYRIELLVNPYKVLHNDTEIGGIYEWNEYKSVFDILNDKLYYLFDELGYLEDWQMDKIDITRDIITPSDTYTHEIISALKAVDLPYGLKPYIPTKQQIEEKSWNEKESFQFSNENQGFKVKVYNKIFEINNRGKEVENDGAGRVRFELSLNKRYLSENKYIYKKSRDYIKNIKHIYQDRDFLMFEHVVCNLDTGSMLSKSLLKKYLRCKCGTKYKKESRMKNLSDEFVKCKKSGKQFSIKDSEFSKIEYAKLKKYYKEYGISPISITDETPYIPSVMDMFNEQDDMKLRRYAEKKTRGKDIWNYEKT